MKMMTMILQKSLELPLNFYSRRVNVKKLEAKKARGKMQRVGKPTVEEAGEEMETGAHG